jgi:hypothetical protein
MLPCRTLSASKTEKYMPSNGNTEPALHLPEPIRCADFILLEGPATIQGCGRHPSGLHKALELGHFFYAARSAL